jgi:CIC family chloride channel protein
LITKNEEKTNKPLAPLTLSFLGFMVGIIAGFGAVAFRGLIAFFHNLLFLGKLSFVYNANFHTAAGPWGPWVILVPVAGAVGVVFLVKNFAPEAKGHGVPEVMDAIYYNSGIIRPIVAIVKSLASALCIGSGGSVGREGPIIQIGSSFGSTLGQIIRMPLSQRITLIAAGTAGGVSATFNTPIGGLLFAIEIMLHEVSVRTLVPVVISTATATYIGRFFFGAYPSFIIPALQIPTFHLLNPLVLFTYIGLGVIAGVVSAFYIKSIYLFEDFFDERFRNAYVRHMAGMFCVGIMMYFLLTHLGHYYIQGVGYSTIQDVLSGKLPHAYLLLLLFLLKLLATSLTLGSGGSGGIFSPSLYMGATLGAAYGVILKHLFPGLALSPAAFAVAGMAGLFAGATGAAVTGIVMIFEMTLDYNVILPMTLTVALGYGIRKYLSRESIYTLKLVRRGHWMPEALQVNLHYIKRVKEVMDTRFRILPAGTRISEIMSDKEWAEGSWLLAEESHQIVGLARKEDVMQARQPADGQATLAEIMNKDFILVGENDSLFDLIARMGYSHASIALVLAGSNPSPGNVRGVITNENIGESMCQTVDMFC